MCSSWCYRSAMTNAAATDWYLLGPQSPNLINSFKHARSPVFEYPNCRGGTALRVGTRFQYLHIRKRKTEQERGYAHSFHISSIERVPTISAAHFETLPLCMSQDLDGEAPALRAELSRPLEFMNVGKRE